MIRSDPKPVLAILVHYSGNIVTNRVAIIRIMLVVFERFGYGVKFIQAFIRPDLNVAMLILVNAPNKIIA